jgi:hypothetical protein
MGEHRWIRRSLESGHDGHEHIIVAVLDGREVVLAVRHWSSGCEKVKSKFDENHSILAVPS